MCCKHRVKDASRTQNEKTRCCSLTVSQAEVPQLVSFTSVSSIFHGICAFSIQGPPAHRASPGRMPKRWRSDPSHTEHTPFYLARVAMKAAARATCNILLSIKGACTKSSSGRARNISSLCLTVSQQWVGT